MSIRAFGALDWPAGNEEPPAQGRMILITNLAAISRHETPAKASRQAYRWLRRRLVQPGDWATILDSATGAVRKRYVRLADGRVERAQ